MTCESCFDAKHHKCHADCGCNVCGSSRARTLKAKTKRAKPSPSPSRPSRATGTSHGDEAADMVLALVTKLHKEIVK